MQSNTKSKGNLAVVDNSAADQPIVLIEKAPHIESMGQRAARLQAEAKQVAKDHIASLSAAMREVSALADEVSQGGDIYPAGVKDAAARLIKDMLDRAESIDAIVARLK